jgi:DHA2 family multidrug resistance protein
VLARRAQYHQSVLVTHVTSFDRTFSENVQSIANRFVDHGYSAADAAMRAVAQVHAVVQQQANILAFLDCFWLLGLVAFIGPVLATFIRKFKQGGTAGAH